MAQFFEDPAPMATTVITVLVALWLIVSAGMKVWPFLSKLVTMVNTFVGTPDKPGLSERVEKIEENSLHERDNHDKMSDQLDRVEAQVQILSRRVDEFTKESTRDRNQLWEIAHKHHPDETQGDHQ